MPNVRVRQNNSCVFFLFFYPSSDSTLVDLITVNPTSGGKILIIGGSIANFTHVAALSKGIIQALKEFKAPLLPYGVRIFVCRGGPNYQEVLPSTTPAQKTSDC